MRIRSTSKRFRAVLGSRLFGAWYFSLIGRTTSLIPLLAVFVAPDLQQRREMGLYFVVFAAAGAVSFVSNYTFDSQISGGEFSFRTQFRRAVPALLTVSVAVAFLLWTILDLSGIEASVVLGVLIAQPFGAGLRTELLTGEGYRFAYASPVVRDVIVVIVLAVVVAADSTSLGLLLPAFGVGNLIQLAALRVASTRFPRGGASGSGPNIGYGWALVAAFGLSAFAPLIRIIVEAVGDGPGDISQLELAERPAYIGALLLAGGVGSEVQRRWTQSSRATVRREVLVATRAIIGYMALVGVILGPSVLVVDRIWPGSLADGFVWLVALAVSLNTLFLLVTLLGRAAVAVGRRALNAMGLACGLVALSLLGWLVAPGLIDSVPAATLASANAALFVSLLVLACGLVAEVNGRVEAE